MKQTIELFLWLYGNLCLLCTVEVHCRLSMVFKLLALTILIESMFSDRLNCIHACIWTAHIKYIRIHIYTKTHAPINIYNVFECGLHMRSAYIYIYTYMYTHIRMSCSLCSMFTICRSLIHLIPFHSDNVMGRQRPNSKHT